MKKSLDEKLCDDFPKIFRQRNDNMTQTAMCWGFCCGDGWYPLIHNLCKSIQDYINDNDLWQSQVEATQVKEKYGELCFYYTGGNELIDGMVWFAENLSCSICEKCGTMKNVKMRTIHGWVSTLCEKCYKEKKLKNKLWKIRYYLKKIFTILKIKKLKN